MDIDEVDINERPKLSCESEIEVDKDCMLIYHVPKSIEKVPTFKIEKNPSTFVLTRQTKMRAKEKLEEQ